jgi:F-type H+-transporting ATPase subunit beta
VLFFVDNIFRFTQAGPRCRRCSAASRPAVGYQPTLATDMGNLQERITTTNKGSITSVQAIYVPADDLTDPAPATSFAHSTHDGAVALDREKGIYPAVDPLDSTSRMLSGQHPGRGALQRRPPGPAGAPALQGAPGHHRDPGHGRAVRGGQADRCARPQDRALPVAALLRGRVFTGSPGKLVALEDTIKGFKGLVEGKYDHLPEAAFYMVGTIEEAIEKAQRLAAEA